MLEKYDEDIQNKDDFIRYFENINNHSDKIPNSNFHNSIISHMSQMLEKLMGKQADDTFNEPFQPNDILKAVKTHKNGKSAVEDLISNEMIKYGFPVLIELILKLFKLIFEKGEFPKLWKESYIILLYKKGKNLTLQTTEGSP